MLQLDAIQNLLLYHINQSLLNVENQLWSVQYSKLGGRGLFANRDIKKGEVIFIDKPLLLGPRCYNKHLPMCVNCYKSSSPLFPCDNGCGLPICSDQCESSIAHVNRECKYLQKLQPTCGTMWSIDLLKAVVPIRSLTLSQYEKDLIDVLQSHNGPRRGCDEIDLLEKSVAKNIEIDEKDFMLRLCRILDTNAFETAVVKDSKSTSLRGLYPLAAFLNHCCIPNSRHYFDKNGLMTVRAAVDIAKDDEITMAYTDFLWHTSLRRKYLMMSKGFECSCRRCADPTEFGSNMSALKCINVHCCGNILPDFPLKSETLWTCNECMNKVSRHQVNEIRSEVKQVVNEVLGASPKEILRFIEKELNTLVPETSYITLDVKFHVISYFGRSDTLQWKDLTDNELQRKAKYCYDLIAILNQVNCGDSQKKGLIHYELYCTKKEQLRRKVSRNEKKVNENLLIEQTKDNDNDILAELFDEVMNVLKDDIAAPDDFMFEINDIILHATEYWDNGITTGFNQTSVSKH